jgi:hypothetical protein
MGVRGRLLAPVAREEGRLDRHEVLHQQIAFFELRQTEIGTRNEKFDTFYVGVIIQYFI